MHIAHAYFLKKVHKNEKLILFKNEYETAFYDKFHTLQFYNKKWLLLDCYQALFDKFCWLSKEERTQVTFHNIITSELIV